MGKISKIDMLLILGLGAASFVVLVAFNYLYEALSNIGLWWLGLLLFWAIPTLIFWGIALYSRWTESKNENGSDSDSDK